MAIKNNGFIKILQDNGCPDEVLSDILDSRIDDMMESPKGASFWLPMAYELSRVHQKGMKHFVEVLHWIIPICGHPVRSLEYTFDLLIRTGNKFGEYTPDLFMDDAVTAAVSRGLFVKILNQGDDNKLDIAAYNVYRDWARKGSKTIINTAISNQVFGDKFHIDQADKIFDTWLRVGLVEKVSGRDDFRFRSCSADAVLACMETVGDKYNAFSHNWQHSVRKCWLEKLALQLVMDSEKGKILLEMEKVKRTTSVKKDEKPKNPAPATKWHPLEINDDEFQVTKPAEKVSKVKPDTTHQERIETINIRKKSEDTAIEESPAEKDSFDMATNLLEVVVQKYYEGWHRDPEKKKKLLAMAKSAIILMEL